jgi:hypothetical protein
MDKTYSTYGLNGSSFDVLATIQRSGEPYGLSPSGSMNSAMVTSGTMTKRINQLVEFVERRPNPQDARGFILSLTNTRVADQPQYSAIESALDSGLERRPQGNGRRAPKGGFTATRLYNPSPQRQPQISHLSQRDCENTMGYSIVRSPIL